MFDPLLGGRTMKLKLLALSFVFFSGPVVGANSDELFERTLSTDLVTSKSPANLPSVGDVSIAGLSEKKIWSKLKQFDEDVPLKFRGAAEVRIFKDHSPSVVLVLTNEGSGSGSLISSGGEILTNWHVVRGYPEVGVVFKPREEGRELKPTDLVRAKVIKIDEVSDLALLKVLSTPKNITPMKLGNKTAAQVGSDVHAIGHPNGQAWTYTKGIISQLRQGYKWSSQLKVKHQADVIQTQTPINPGNSGGPLISGDGELMGVNAFKARGEGLNFAISVGEVKNFLESALKHKAAATIVPKKMKCTSKIVSEGRDKTRPEFVRKMDLNCDGIVDASLVVPDDKTKGLKFLLDKNGDGRVDIVVVDNDRDGKWDVSYFDIDSDGKTDLVGKHPDGSIKPSSYKPYKQ
jgi:S1-C subfamily serine protease